VKVRELAHACCACPAAVVGDYDWVGHRFASIGAGTGAIGEDCALDAADIYSDDFLTPACWHGVAARAEFVVASHGASGFVWPVWSSVFISSYCRGAEGKGEEGSCEGSESHDCFTLVVFVRYCCSV